MSDPTFRSGTAILRLYWDILRLRRGPEDLPVSAQLLVATVAMRIGLGSLVNGLLAAPQDHATALMIIDCVVALAWGRVLLQVAKKPERYLQMVTAIFGCELLLQVLSGVALATFLAGQSSGSNGLTQLAALLASIVYIWILVAVIRIVRSATGWPVVGCIVAVIVQGAVTLAIALSIFPDLMEQMTAAPKPAG